MERKKQKPEGDVHLTSWEVETICYQNRSNENIRKDGQIINLGECQQYTKYEYMVDLVYYTEYTGKKGSWFNLKIVPP